MPNTGTKLNSVSDEVIEVQTPDQALASVCEIVYRARNLHFSNSPKHESPTHILISEILWRKLGRASGISKVSHREWCADESPDAPAATKYCDKFMGMEVIAVCNKGMTYCEVCTIPN